MKRAVLMNVAVVPGMRCTVPRTLSRVCCWGSDRSISLPSLLRSLGRNQAHSRGSHSSTSSRSGGREQFSPTPACVRRVGVVRYEAACSCSMEGDSRYHSRAPSRSPPQGRAHRIDGTKWPRSAAPTLHSAGSLTIRPQFKNYCSFFLT